jgi:GNAT superfamily N-acetyltransferase
MSRSVVCRLMKAEEAGEVCRLVERVFMEFVAPGYPPAGVAEFLSVVDAEKMRRRVSAGNLVLVAQVEDRLAGMIEIRGLSHVMLMFVDKAFHRQGVARRLFETALSRCLKSQPDLKAVTVHASPNAVPVYGRLGFEATGPEAFQSGMFFTPMRLDLSAAPGSP